MRSLTHEQAWTRSCGENPLCDACRKRALGEAGQDSIWSRPYQFKSLAKLGIFNVLCFECSTPSVNADVGEYAPAHWTEEMLTNFVEVCVARESYPRGGDPKMADVIMPTVPYDPGAVAAPVPPELPKKPEEKAKPEEK